MPFCVHLMQDGECAANAYRYDFGSNAYRVLAEGKIGRPAGRPSFDP